MAAFVAAALMIVFAGTRLAGLADRLADRTGLGEAFTGAVLLGASTSLPGITASVTAAWDGMPELALSNALGGIAVQTAFLAIADCFYRQANLEHAAASASNMMMGALLIALLAAILIAMVGPTYEIFSMHVMTPILFAGYVLGMRMIYTARSNPMWLPNVTQATRLDKPDKVKNEASLRSQWIHFAVSAVIVIVAGWTVTRAAESFVVHVGISASMAGGLLVAISTSLPELVTSVAAVRRGALTLAVGGILGGNAFDTLFAAAADIAYTEGSIYQAVSDREISLVALTIMMSAVLLLGLLRRQKKGIGNIGFESVLVLVFYVLGVVMLVTD